MGKEAHSGFLADVDHYMGFVRAQQMLQDQVTAALATRLADPTKAVLISPRIRGNVIERIVQTYGDRVVGEFLHSSAGWTRHGRMDLRVVFEGMPLPARISAAISPQPGELDELPTSECLARMRAIDAKAQFSDDDSDAGGDSQQGLVDFFHDGSETVRLTEAEVRKPDRYGEPGRSALDASNAEIAAAVLEIVPALWNSATIIAVAKEDGFDRDHVEDFYGFDMRVHGPRPEDRSYHPSGKIRALVSRRFEMMETTRGHAWRRMVFLVARADHPEWQCRVTYDY